jgi:hypothetical protein
MSLFYCILAHLHPGIRLGKKQESHRKQSSERRKKEIDREAFRE